MRPLRYKPWRAIRKRHRVIAGLAPGTVATHTTNGQTSVQVTAYSSDDVLDVSLDNPDDLPPLLEKWPSVWIHVEGLANTELITRIGAHLGLHKLALEDVVNRNQQPKLEEYDGHLFVVAHAAASKEQLDFGQVNIFIAERFVVTMQENPLSWEEPVRKRIREGRTRIRSLGANYLGYALVDSIVDGYYPYLELCGDRLNALEDDVLSSPAQDELERIHHIRNEILSFRRTLVPLRAVLKTLAKDELPPVTDETRLFLRDCHDHLVQIIDTLETDREMARGFIDLCLSSTSNRMNEVMKVLTIIATIFIPLGFIAGLYGMNFNPAISPLNMPELGWYFGYPFALILMLITVVGLLLFFWKKGWIGTRPRKRE